MYLSKAPHIDMCGSQRLCRSAHLCTYLSVFRALAGPDCVLYLALDTIPCYPVSVETLSSLSVLKLNLLSTTYKDCALSCSAGSGLPWISIFRASGIATTLLLEPIAFQIRAQGRRLFESYAHHVARWGILYALTEQFDTAYSTFYTTTYILPDTSNAAPPNWLILKK